MGPGQSEPNDFELAVLNRLAKQEPALLAAIGQVHVLSREFTGVGSFTNFDCDQSANTAQRPVCLNALIQMPGVPHGMGAVLFLREEKPECLEVFTYGDAIWEGVYDGFSIEESK